MYEPDIVLLDIMMPKKDGWQVCREIREHSSEADHNDYRKGRNVFDKVLGLELGADDFIVKPLDMKEVFRTYQSRSQKICNARHPSDGEMIKFDNLEISLQKYELKIGGKVGRSASEGACSALFPRGKLQPRFHPRSAS